MSQIWRHARVYLHLILNTNPEVPNYTLWVLSIVIFQPPKKTQNGAICIIDVAIRYINQFVTVYSADINERDDRKKWRETKKRLSQIDLTA